MATYSFETRSLAVGYNGKALIENIQIAIEPGQVMTLIGPNGAGKSTILKSITKQLDVIGGSVLVQGRELAGISATELARVVSMLFSTAPRTELLTCRDIIETGRYPYTGRMGVLTEEDHARVDQIMRITQVWDLRERDFSQLSDGQRQRVLLARALCQEPKILIMDEPTSFLDIRYQIELLGLVRKMTQEQDLSVIMSLHELDMAQRLSDVVLAVKDNAVFRYGKPEDIFTREIIGELYGIDLSEYKPLFSC